MEREPPIKSGYLSLSKMSSKNYIKILIADDHEIFLDGLRLLLNNIPGIIVTGEANNGIQLVNLARQDLPDVILTDIVMPIMDGIAAVKEIHATNPQTGIIALSMFDEEHYIVECSKPVQWVTC